MMEMHEYKEKPGACAACGNSPVNHHVAFVFNTLNAVFSVMSHRITGTRVLSALDTGARIMMETMDVIHTAVMQRIGAVRWGTDPQKARTYRSQVIWEEAARRGIRMEQMFLFGMASDVYRAHLRGAWHYFKSIPLPPEVPQDAYLWIDDKTVLKEELRRIGIPTPESESVSSYRDARTAFARLGGLVVVKPRCGSRGRHTTTLIKTDEDLARAFTVARQLCAFVSIERHLQGPVCRGTVVGGKLAGFFAAEAPRVIGDGHSTIAELVEKVNASRHERVQPIALTAEHESQLSRQGFSVQSVVPHGVEVVLSHRTGRLFGGETRELLDTVHPRMREYLEKAARGLRVPIVGFDLIIPNPEADPDTQGWGVIEANSLPFIDLHYLPLHGKPSNPAAAVWDLWK